MKTLSVSIIIPCKDEQSSIGSLIEELQANTVFNEIIIVDDGSTDNTQDILKQYKDIIVIKNPYSKGNGAAIKSGARKAKSDLLLFMDADGQHKPEDIPNLIAGIHEGYDMVVGARASKSQASLPRLIGNNFYNKFASLITGHKIKDLTSGFRVCKKDLFLQFIALLPNRFSYPTTITMAFIRNGYSVKYTSIECNERTGKSHISLLKDGLRFLIIIFKIGSLYSPLKIIAPISLFLFSSGLGLYLYNYIVNGKLTNMSMMLLMTSTLIFIIGLISEQVTTLIYMSINKSK
ncbi:MAG: glycosyl transferase [Gammaproteobacteria bacterium]|nr:MAG: glycosyl transferase [Gammaproteobacteria bacterium]